MTDRPASRTRLRRNPIPAAALLVAVLALGAGPAVAAEQFARLHTDAGEILVHMDPELAPHHVANFLHLARSGFYDGTYFHRVIPGFMIQGGDPLTLDDSAQNDGTGGPMLKDVMSAKDLARAEELYRSLTDQGYIFPDPAKTPANLKAEFDPSAHHTRGALSMARGNNPDSAGSQFFICVGNPTHLDGQYSLFGRVVTGIDVADAIVAGPRKPGPQNMPVDPVHITKIDVLEGTSGLTADEKAAWKDMQEAAAAAAAADSAAGVD